MAAPAALASPVVNRKAIEALAGDSRRATADAVNAGSEGAQAPLSHASLLARASCHTECDSGAGDTYVIWPTYFFATKAEC